MYRELEKAIAFGMERNRFDTRWGTPLVAFAAADDPLFADLKEAVSGTHLLPGDLLPGARTVVAFFLPLAPAVAASNYSGFLASQAWAQAYLDANLLIGEIGWHLKAFLEDHGHAAALTQATHNFDPDRLISDWSHRHVAFIAGLGRFGVNRMLITERGCCGRLGSLVTSLPLDPDPRPEEEFCLFRRDGSCLRCVERCVGKALSPQDLDRHTCYAVCLKNEAVFQNLGKADVCGKCLVDVPCSGAKPG
ncbi:MAG: epoxyqueuosine reductase [Deltaproteobacteria bacterium]|nr:epoxyqueuosine reductase [Deltaproteobacteria bacterium]